MCRSLRLPLRLAVSFLGWHALAAHAADAPRDCEGLASRKILEHTTITSAKRQPANAERHRPPFCEVIATATPVPGSNITIVVRMPDTWNGKLLGSGGGGWAGNTNLQAPGPGLPDGATPGLVAGYAVAQTNGGHEVKQGNIWDTSWTANPEAVVDFSYRAIHVMTDVAKALVTTYYGRPLRHAYFEGCSTGGRQALMEVQRYPKDYDGVIAGAPVYTLTVQTMSVVRNQAFARAEPLTAAQIQTLQTAALEACDGNDGLVDGVITDPRACTFDPGTLQCGVASNHDQQNCLTPKQVQTLRTVYAGVKNAAGETVAYPLARGSEGSWTRFISAAKAPTDEDFNTGAAGAGLGGLRALLFKDPNFNLRAFDIDKDYRTVRASAFAAGYEAKNPDISAFVQAGGKLLLWHGMLDPGPSPLATIEYFDEVQKITRPKVKSLDANARLFIEPGVYHCRGGPGADEVNFVDAIDKWVEHGKAPSTLLATRADHALSRPVCRYPALPRYKGKGDPNSADSFVCR